MEIFFLFSWSDFTDTTHMVLQQVSYCAWTNATSLVVKADLKCFFVSMQPTVCCAARITTEMTCKHVLNASVFQSIATSHVQLTEALFVLATFAYSTHK